MRVNFAAGLVRCLILIAGTGAVSCVGTVGNSRGEPSQPRGMAALDPTAPGGAGGSGAGVADTGGAGGAAAGPACDPQSAVSLAPTPLRRLSRTQYAHTIRDLFGRLGGADMAAKVAEAAGHFPADEHVGPFAANVAASISEAHGRAYMDAAELLAEAVTKPDLLPQVLPCKPTTDADSACAERFIREFGQRAFRRPLADGVVSALKLVHAQGVRGSGFSGGIRLVIQALLQAPDFLYHIEAQTPVPGSALAVPLSGFEVASRLSYFFWDSMPDDLLLAAAAQGQLGTPDNLRKQVDRLLADGRARDAFDRFASDWLGLGGLETITRDATLFPAFSPVVAAGMRAETLEFVDQVVHRGDGLLTTLLTGSMSYPPDGLLKIYGAARTAPAPAAVQLPKDQRAGVLTQASVLAATSHTDHTSPVKRGVFVLNNILCHEIAFPDGLTIPPLPDPDPNKTTRERFAQHTQQPACAVCHSIIDPLGFAFERYDSIGAYRDKESGHTIDDSGTIQVGAPDLDGNVQGAVQLAIRLASSDKVRACMTKQVQRFALGRMEQPADACTLARLQGRFADSGYSLRELMIATAIDPSFRSRPAATP